MICFRHCRFMALHFQIIIVSKQVLIPLDGFFCFRQQSLSYLFGHFTAQARRTDNQTFVIFLQLVPVCTGTHIVTFGPCPRNQFYQVMIPLLVFGEHNQVIPALVRLSLLFIHCTASHIHLTAYDRLEQSPFRIHYFSFTVSNLGIFIRTLHFTGFNSCNPLLQVLYFSFRTSIFLINIVRKLFNGEHVSMVRNGNTFHPVFHSLIDQCTDTGLTIQKRILRMDV